MKKIILLIHFTFCILNFSFSQNPLVKQWDFRFGGNYDDKLQSFQQTSDGGYILGGFSLLSIVNLCLLEHSISIATHKGARTICVDKKTHHIYLPTAEYGDTPAATQENPRPRPVIKPGTFVVLDIAP